MLKVTTAYGEEAKFDSANCPEQAVPSDATNLLTEEQAEILSRGEWRLYYFYGFTSDKKIYNPIVELADSSAFGPYIRSKAEEKPFKEYLRIVTDEFDDPSNTEKKFNVKDVIYMVKTPFWQSDSEDTAIQADKNYGFHVVFNDLGSIDILQLYYKIDFESDGQKIPFLGRIDFYRSKLAGSFWSSSESSFEYSICHPGSGVPGNGKGGGRG